MDINVRIVIVRKNDLKRPLRTLMDGDLVAVLTDMDDIRLFQDTEDTEYTFEEKTVRMDAFYNAIR